MQTTLWSNVVLILFWYASNILVVISNKYLLSNHGFKYPIFLTGCHMAACAVMGYAVALLQLVPRQYIQSRMQLLKVIVLASVFCLSVVLGNVSLRFIPVSFNQAIGATTPFFTAVLSFILLSKRETRWVYISLIPVVVGIVVASQGEPLFNLAGFSAALAATGARAFKSVMQGWMLSDSDEQLDSMNLLLYMAPIAALLLLPLMLFIEGNVISIVHDQALADSRFLPTLLLNASLAFAVNLTNFMVTKHTSALTLQVLGNGKGVVAAVISVMVFKNPVTIQGAVGYAITVGGVVCYSQAKKRDPKEQALPSRGMSPMKGLSPAKLLSQLARTSPGTGSSQIIRASPGKGALNALGKELTSPAPSLDIESQAALLGQNTDLQRALRAAPVTLRVSPRGETQAA